MKILLGVPSRRTDDVERIRDLMLWAWGLDKHEVRFLLDSTYGVDVARSRIIEEAKRWGAGLLIMVDTDCAIRISPHSTLSILSQAWSRGFGMLVSPTVSSQGKIMVMAPKHQTPFGKPSDIPLDGAFEIAWGALGFAAIRGEAIEKLKPIGESKYLNADPSPLYCRYEVGGDGEDKSLCENLASTGYKVGADVRLYVDHYKYMPIPSYRGPVHAV